MEHKNVICAAQSRTVVFLVSHSHEENIVFHYLCCRCYNPCSGLFYFHYLTSSRLLLTVPSECPFCPSIRLVPIFRLLQVHWPTRVLFLDTHRLVVHYDLLYTKFTVIFGLYERCESSLSEFPSGGGKISYSNYTCRHFPGSVTDGCEKENKAFCGAWISAGYIDELAIGFASVSLVAILFGVTTHSRRRRIWRAVFGLLVFQSTFSLQ